MKITKCLDCGENTYGARCRSCYSKTMRGRKLSEQARKNIAAAKMGDKNPMWKGDSAKYVAIHDWVCRNKPYSETCESCGEKPGYSGRVKKLDAANISGKYLRDLSDWQWLCRRCHMEKDGRLKELSDMGRLGKEHPKWKNVPSVDKTKQLRMSMSIVRSSAPKT